MAGAETADHAVPGDYPEGVVPKKDDVFIAIMGVTGAGKSTFISHCTEQEVQVGHSLQACTQEVAFYQCQYSEDVNVYLIDTPGFDDTNRSDTEVLKEIAASLAHLYGEANIKLHGIIYLHRVSDDRLGGSAKRNLYMFRKLCGPQAFRNVVLATTMWERVSEDEGIRREKELETTADFWGWMKDQGSSIHRHSNDRTSALRLIEHFVQKPPDEAKVVLELQRQMVDEEMDLNRTDAGQEVDGGLAEERRKQEQNIRELREQLEEARESHDQVMAEAMEEEKARVEKQMQLLVQQQEDLKVSVERLYEEKYAKMQEEFERSEREKEKILAQLYIAKQEQAEQQRKAEAQGEQLTLQMSRMEELQKQLQDLSTTSKVRSHPGQNEMSRWPVSMSIVGEHCWFVAKVRDYGKAPPGFPAERTTRGNGNRYVALGDGGAWYAHYRDTAQEDHTALSDNFQKVYPEAYGFFQQHPNEAPICVSLGPEGSYFINTAGGSSRKFPAKIEEDFKDVDIAKFESVWLGCGGAYFVQAKTAGGENGNATWARYWNLQGQYPGLAKVARLRGKQVKLTALAMDLKDPDLFTAVWQDGSANHGPVRNHQFEYFEFEEWCTENFGTVWKSRDSRTGTPSKPTSIFYIRPQDWKQMATTNASKSGQAGNPPKRRRWYAPWRSGKNSA